MKLLVKAMAFLKKTWRLVKAMASMNKKWDRLERYFKGEGKEVQEKTEGVDEKA